MLSLILCLKIFVSFVSSAQFPNEVSKCSYGDSKCISEVINDILNNKFEGFPRLGLPSLDPIKIDRLDIERDEKSPVNIKLNFKNINLSGFSKAKVFKLSGFRKNPQGDKIEIRFKTPNLAITGPYKSNGKILLLPITGEGNSNLTLDNVDLTMKFITKAVERDGKTYMQIDKSKISFETTRLHIQMSRLFSGKNNALAENLSQFMNENWEEILKELKPPIVDGFGKIFVAIINNVLNNFPYSDLFKN